jgi:hypothetical protein
LLAIAASADFGYNSQPNQSIPSLFLVQVLSSGWESKRWADAHFFFVERFFRPGEVRCSSLN